MTAHACYKLPPWAPYAQPQQTKQFSHESVKQCHTRTKKNNKEVTMNHISM